MYIDFKNFIIGTVSVKFYANNCRARIGILYLQKLSIEKLPSKVIFVSQFYSEKKQRNWLCFTFREQIIFKKLTIDT